MKNMAQQQEHATSIPAPAPVSQPPTQLPVIKHPPRPPAVTQSSERFGEQASRLHPADTTLPALQALARARDAAAVATASTATSATAGGKTSPPPRTEEENQIGGSLLMGFLSSLRQSYLEAVKEKGINDDNDDVRLASQKEHQMQTTIDAAAPAPATMPTATEELLRRLTSNSSSTRATVSESAWSGTSSSTQQPESSVEDSDWNSDKKTDPSSSEDSDREMNPAVVAPSTACNNNNNNWQHRVAH